MGNASSRETLTEVLNQSDFVTLHVPETPQTYQMIAGPELAQMKVGAFLINASRGTVIQMDALAAALKKGHLGGVALDVFPEEPENNDQVFQTPVQNMPNVFLTPHIGGSTEEAQQAIGQEVSESLLRFLKFGSTHGAVNFPQLDVPPIENAQRIANVHRNVPGVLREINSLVSQAGANIKAQYLSTDPNIGYLIMDVEGAEARALSQQIAALSTSIKTRLLEA